MQKKFRTTVELGGKTATGFRVPVEIVAALGHGVGVRAGDDIEVELALDTEPRVAGMPADLKEALATDKETRQRRIAKVVSDMKDGKK
ncbi:MAG: YdeI/OmpD-associated family protein [Acidimicrobiia bacterium]